MIISWLLAAHITVLGYWLGSELVINSTYRYVCYHDELPFPDRSRLMDHVMKVDQHVRYALILQAGLGTAIAALYGWFPGGETVAIAAGIIAALWLAYVEVTHRLRKTPVGKKLQTFDRGSRYVLMVILIALAFGLIGGDWPMPLFLRWKLGLFAGVMASGVGIRIALLSHFRTWARMAKEGPTDETNAIIRRTYWRATSVLILLWVSIAGIVVVSLWKPM